MHDVTVSELQHDDAAINTYLLLLCGYTQQHSMTNDVLVHML